MVITSAPFPLNLQYLNTYLRFWPVEFSAQSLVHAFLLSNCSLEKHFVFRISSVLIWSETGLGRMKRVKNVTLMSEA